MLIEICAFVEKMFLHKRHEFQRVKMDILIVCENKDYVRFSVWARSEKFLVISLDVAGICNGKYHCDINPSHSEHTI
jgi:hypothetical protein